MAVEFQDYSFEVKAELNDISRSWLRTWANEIASHARDNTKLDGEAGVQLRKSYRADVDEAEGVAHIGTSLESGYWEEFGTGEHAVHGDGRKDWWVYIEGGSGYEGPTAHYATKEDAEAAAKFINAKYGKKAVATNGREPSYTLQNAFTVNRPKAEADLERKLRGMNG